MAARARTTLSCLNEYKRARERTNSSKSHSFLKLRTLKKRRESENIKNMQGTQDDDIKTCERLDFWHSSIGLLQHLYTDTPSHTTLVQETLTRLLLITDVTLKGKVTGHARRQVRATNDWAQPIEYRLDGSPAYVCEAVRHLQELQQFQDMEELPQY